METAERITRYVRWHVETLAAPAPKADIVAMVHGKWPHLSETTIGAFILDLVDRGELRFVTHDFLPDGYATVEDPS